MDQKALITIYYFSGFFFPQYHYPSFIKYEKSLSFVCKDSMAELLIDIHVLRILLVDQMLKNIYSFDCSVENRLGRIF